MPTQLDFANDGRDLAETRDTEDPKTLFCFKVLKGDDDFLLPC